ncbi:ROK family protein [Thiomonas bhubaneswarensis]|uniref:Sugar kinase of the NBD/HSP70 family, may contain an N-terminal HTH domain n=1 Tax=Thiomonas bhubaneswarensis TaxID=339866 RepID=A0A0K6I7J2_9BURK|nr:ROK family protein [Thiomonas bhubaneswarensis]CUA99038.1 Sugar kinase of the NBD/HSP70 family, may contain an N-terminal HTH domain [Thiomonas bhubaneswarensis]
MAEPAPLIGLDLGGTKIEVAVLDGQGRFLLRERRPTPQGDYAATLRVMGELVAQADAHLAAMGVGRLPVGVAIPGSISPNSGLIRNANSTVLNGKPLLADLQALLARPVRLHNDANCLAVSEAIDGAGQGARLVFAVILGTGVGAGIAIGGRDWLGCNAVAGEWGHNPLPWPRTASAWGELPGPRCWCGLQGCIETWLSGPAFAADHALHTGQQLAAHDITAAMRRGDAAARASFIRYCDRLARALAHVINLLDPEVIVLGGGMSNVGELYTEVPQRWGAWVFSDEVRTRLLPAMHGDSSGVRGAAWLWRDQATPFSSVP